MTPDRWQQIERLYHSAQARPNAERQAFLDAACEGDAGLRAEVDSLLAQDDADPAFLSGHAIEMAARLVSAPAFNLVGQKVRGYDVISLIGAGGMGEVYRARDTRLQRDVAIKVIPPSFVEDAVRLSRFTREAQLLASMNHPHIATVYGLEDGPAANGQPTTALVMEFVDGPTLATRVETGPLPLDETLRVARQLADALDAAHDKGIVHRDLKPANIAFTAAGAVKVLDFGIARLAPRESGDVPSSAVATSTGAVVGTAAYMSPEQARGQPTDKRTDIWAFGCVVYEMLTSVQAFKRDTVTDTLVAVLGDEPDWSQLPATASGQVRRLLKRCLEKDPQRRLRDIGDARYYLADDTEGGTDVDIPATPVATSWWRTSVVAGVGLAAGAMLLAVGVLFGLRSSPAPSPAVTVRTTVLLPPGYELASNDGGYPLAISDDGHTLAFVAAMRGERQLFVRELDELQPRLLPGTAGADFPFFSPDGQSLGFFAADALQRIDVRGGSAVRVCDVSAAVIGGSWGRDNTIVWATRGTADLWKVPASGGAPQHIVGSGPGVWPQVLPGGMVLFTTGANGAGTAIGVVPLAGGSRRIIARKVDSSFTDGPPVLGTGGVLAQARLLPSGHLVYGQSPGIVRVVPFDPVSLTPTGALTSLADSVERARNGGAVFFVASPSGVVAYATTSEQHQLVWANRHGATTPLSDDRAAFRLPRVSPDGSTVAVAINDETRRSDLWLYDAVRGTRRRFTNELHNLNPVWSPDGRSLTFSRGAAGVVETDVTANGKTSLLLSPAESRSLLPGASAYPSSWSPDHRTLIVQADERGLWAWSTASHSAQQLEKGPGNRFGGRFSPDGHWIAYSSDESGRSEVYLARYPDLTDRLTVSQDGGMLPVWAHDGRELFYRRGNAVMAVAFGSDIGRPAKPQQLFEGRFTGTGRDPSFDVAPDGRFVFVKSDEASLLRELTVVQNAFAPLPGVRPEGRR